MPIQEMGQMPAKMVAKLLYAAGCPVGSLQHAPGTLVLDRVEFWTRFVQYCDTLGLNGLPDPTPTGFA